MEVIICHQQKVNVVKGCFRIREDPLVALLETCGRNSTPQYVEPEWRGIEKSTIPPYPTIKHMKKRKSSHDPSKQRTQKWTPCFSRETNISPSRIMVGRLYNRFRGHLFLIFAGGEGGIKQQNQKNKTSTPLRPSNFIAQKSRCQGTGNFNSTPSKVKEPEKDNIPMA